MPILWTFYGLFTGFYGLFMEFMQVFMEKLMGEICIYGKLFELFTVLCRFLWKILRTYGIFMENLLENLLEKLEIP